MELRLNMGGLSSFVAVPAEVVDKHLGLVSGIYIKVLLAVLRANRVDTGQIARKLSIPESDVEEAVRYWIQNGVFTEEAAAPRRQPPEKKAPQPGQSLTSEEIVSRLNRQPDLQFLFTTAESMLGTLLGPMQRSSLIYIHESLGMPVDVIVMAIEYCVSIGKGNLPYIQKLCAGWADRGINTHALAEETIRAQNAKKTREGQVKELLHLDRVTRDQQGYLNHWIDKLGYSVEIIQLAYERTLNSINKLSLPYMNSILNSWYEKGIRAPEDVERKDPRAGRSGEKSSPSYDLDELERRGFQVPEI